MEQIAEQGIPLAVLSGVPERWYELVLVVDVSPSMWVWELILDALARLLEHNGAFRRVRVWCLDSTGCEARLHPGRDASRTCRPQELLVPGGRCLILMVSDCIARAWHCGSVQALLRLWATASPTAVLQMLPQNRWPESGLGRGEQVRLSATRGGGANAALRAARRDTTLDALIRTEALKLPVLTLEAGALAAWAAVLSGTPESWIAGISYGSGARFADPRRRRPSVATQAMIDERLEHFLATAAPRAQLLAGYLAAAPLSLPVMRLVQRVLLPGSRPEDLAELTVSGLLKRVSAEKAHGRWLHYEFHDGVRDALIRLVPAADGAHVLRLLSDYVAGHTGGRLSFQALLADPHAIGDLILNEEDRYFAMLGARVLRRLGGAYRRLADRLIDEQIFEPVHPLSKTLRSLNEAKMLVVGNEAVGKTSLIRYLVRNEPCNPYEPKTPGTAIHEKIETQTWSPEDSGVTLNVWDFGGQEIMRGTHRFFLTRRSLYLLVLEARREDDLSVYDWLKMIRYLGGDSPVIVVINKCDDGTYNLHLDETGLKQAYPAIVGFARTSCNPDASAAASIARLRELIVEQLVGNERLRHVRDVIPQSWLRVKEAVAALARRERVFTVRDFERLCETAGEDGGDAITDITEQRALLQLLHDLGVVVAHGLGRRAPAALREITLLDPDYGMWPDDALRFRFAYDLLPPGLIPRFIVQAHRNLTDRPTRWRTGMILGTAGCRILVRGDRDRRRIDISVAGPASLRRSALNVVLDDLDEVHARNLEMGAKALVPLPGQPELDVSYDHLLRLEARYALGP